MNVTRREYVHVARLMNARRVEIVVLPRLTCTVTRPEHPTDLAIPVGSVSLPETVNRYGALSFREGVTFALSLPLRRTIAAAGGGGAAAAASRRRGGGGVDRRSAARS